MIAPDEAEKLEAMKAGGGLEFPVLMDPELETVRAYGILNEKSGKLPHPTALVIDREGVVRYLRVDVDYKVRPAPAEILEALGGL